MLYKNGCDCYAITIFWASAICYILLNGLCYMILHTPGGGGGLLIIDN